MTRSPFRLAWPLLALAAPAWADLASVETPQGPARVEGDPTDGGERLMVGDRVAFASAEEPYLWIEASRGTLLLVGIATGGTACGAEWIWLDAADPGFRATERFGTCADAVTVTSDAETVTVSMASSDPDHPTSDFVWDGKGPVREVPRGQEASASPPEAGADPWVGRYPYELMRAADWRGPLVDLLGEDGYAAAQAAIDSASPMAVEGGWVAGSGFERNAGASGAVAIARDDGRLLVAVRSGPDAEPRLWGDPRGDLPASIAAVMAGTP